MKDKRGRSERPKPIGAALNRALGPVKPKTSLAELQSIWPSVAGPAIAAVTSVSEERNGTVTIECESTVWAAELEMMAPQFQEKLRPLMGDLAPEILRFRASPGLNSAQRFP